VSDADARLAPGVPPVVAVVVVHDPGPWFDESLDSFAAQDHANLRWLFLVHEIAPEPATSEIEQRVRAVIPDAFVRRARGDGGFGATANVVVDLVEGEHGFFCFLHDDVVLAPDAIRLLVEEIYRSNAGIVGPKLVDWDDPARLRSVGLGVDRIGEVDEGVEDGEFDQEQHDAVRDVFALPTACMLVRADLFRRLLFAAHLDFAGDDLDICWRAHLVGARVVVVPTARVRHRGGLVDRRPERADARVAAKARVDTVLALTGRRRLAFVIVWLVAVTLAEFVVSILAGRARPALASLSAVATSPLRLGAVFARRRQVRPLRVVPDHEIAELQLRGSARVTRYLRARTARAEKTASGRVVLRSPTVTVVAWTAVVAFLLVGSRQLLSGGVGAIGDFLPFPESARALFTSYRTGWWSHGIGSGQSAPTAHALMAALGAVTFGNMGLAHTIAVLGLVLLGLVGVWKVVSSVPNDRARVAALVVYAAVPLPYAAIAGGSWATLLGYAAVPLVVHLLGRAVGLVEPDDGSPEDMSGRRIRAMAGAVIVTAAGIAFVASFATVVIVTTVAVALAVGLSVVAQRFDRVDNVGAGDVRPVSIGVSAAVLGTGVIAVTAGFLLNLPWAYSLVQGGSDAYLGVAIAGSRGEGFIDIATFSIGARTTGTFGLVALGLYLPVVIAPFVTRGWRHALALRGLFLVVVPEALVLAADSGRMPELVADPGVLLAPVGLGMALSAAALVAAFADDLRGRSFGWAQPLGIVALTALVVGTLPTVVAAGGGRWNQERQTLSDLLAQLPADPPEGDYRVLFVGDPRVVPVSGWRIGEGMAFSIVDDGPIDATRHWSSRPTAGVRSAHDALVAAAEGTTDRIGRLLAPLGVRYLVVPLLDGASSTVDAPVPAPVGIFDALGDQLDLKRRYASAELVIYENIAHVPVRSVLTGGSAELSRSGGASVLVRSEVPDAVPFAVGGLDGASVVQPTDFEAGRGVVLLGVPLTDGWRLEAGGSVIAPRPAFGTVTAFDLPEGATAMPVTLRFEQQLQRTITVAAQVFAWLLLAVVAVGAYRWRPVRRAGGVAIVEGGPVVGLDFDATVDDTVDDTFDDPGYTGR
jgi:GT2 family glycosyltransferase